MLFTAGRIKNSLLQIHSITPRGNWIAHQRCFQPVLATEFTPAPRNAILVDWNETERERERARLESVSTLAITPKLLQVITRTRRDGKMKGPASGGVRFQAAEIREIAERSLSA